MHNKKAKFGEKKINCRGQKFTLCWRNWGPLCLGSTKRGHFNAQETVNFKLLIRQPRLPGNKVKHISKGTDGSYPSVDRCRTGTIVNKECTLFDKAQYYEKQVRTAIFGLGWFIATLVGMEDGIFGFKATFRFRQRRTFWTTMYLSWWSFSFMRWPNPKMPSTELWEAMDAMERLFQHYIMYRLSI